MQQKELYDKKLEDLIQRITYRLDGSGEEEKKEYTPCFISYCWQNSAKAVARGSRHRDGSLGYGDPREIKKYLEENGVKTWIDIERVGMVG